MRYVIIETTVDADTLESARCILCDDHGNEYWLECRIRRGTWVISVDAYCAVHARSVLRPWQRGDVLHFPDPDMMQEARVDVYRLLCEHLGNRLENAESFARKK